jgi:hypothetical protein
MAPLENASGIPEGRPFQEAARQSDPEPTQAHAMKKSFPLSDPKHKPERVVAAIKNDVRKYVKRERGKKLPEGTDYWDFACKVGKGTETPEQKHLEEVVPAIDEAFGSGCESVYIEILAVPGIRTKK